MKNLSAFIIGLLAILIIGGATANAASWTVTKSTNSSDNVCDADCSLREAVFVADSGDTVVFDSNLVGQTFTLGGSEIVITKRITIDGFLNNPNVAFISGGNASRHFYVQDGAGLDLKNITLVQGNGKPFNGAVGSTEGGAIYVRPTATLQLDRVAIRNNAADLGGAIRLGSGPHHITNSSITSNSGSAASAIFNNGGSLYIANVTVSGNFTPDTTNSGHAIWNNNGDVFIRNSTIVRNTTTVNGGEGGGIFNRLNGRLNIGNTIVAQNTDEIGTDIKNEAATITSVGGNLIGDLGSIPANTFNQPNDIFGVNPLLAPSNANLGGFHILSHPLQAGSPARNGGINANAVDPLTNTPLITDARGTGFPRITDTTVDKGAFEDQSGNTSLIVSKKTNSNDSVCDTDCSLREAVHQASLNFGTDTITFAPNVFGTVSLGGTEISIVNHNVNIVGYPSLNANTLTVSGGNANRIFTLNNATVKITGMTLANGKVVGDNGGGAILAYNNSSLTLDKTIVRNNTAPSVGAIYLINGIARISNSTISNNSAADILAIGSYGTLYLSNTTVSNNFQVFNRSDADAENTNRNAGTTAHGAIFSGGTTNIRNSTISFNRSTTATGGGIYVDGLLNIGNSIVSNNSALNSPDIHKFSGAILSVDGNLVSNSSGFPNGTFSQTNDAVNVDPLLAALADNGGSVPTHSLTANSPAINTGVNANAIDPFDNSVLTTDARGSGFARTVSVVDKGAFEAFVPTAAAVSISGRVINGKRGIARARVYLTGQNGETRTAATNSFGYFSFNEVQSGETYIVNVISKSYTFTPRVITVNEDLTDLNFSAEPADWLQQ